MLLWWQNLCCGVQTPWSEQVCQKRAWNQRRGPSLYTSDPHLSKKTFSFSFPLKCKIRDHQIHHNMLLSWAPGHELPCAARYSHKCDCKRWNVFNCGIFVEVLVKVKVWFLVQTASTSTKEINILGKCASSLSYLEISAFVLYLCLTTNAGQEIVWHIIPFKTVVFILRSLFGLNKQDMKY